MNFAIIINWVMKKSDNNNEKDQLNMYTAGDCYPKSGKSLKAHTIVIFSFWFIVVCLFLGRLLYDTITNVTDSFIRLDGSVVHTESHRQDRMTYHLGEMSNSFLFYEEVFEGNEHTFDRVTVCSDLTDFNRYGEFLLDCAMQEDEDGLISNVVWNIGLPERYDVKDFNTPIQTFFSGKFPTVDFETAFSQRKKVKIRPGEDTVLFALYMNTDDQKAIYDLDTIQATLNETGQYPDFSANENTILVHIVLSEGTKEQLIKELK